MSPLCHRRSQDALGDAEWRGRSARCAPISRLARGPVPPEQGAVAGLYVGRRQLLQRHGAQGRHDVKAYHEQLCYTHPLRGTCSWSSVGVRLQGEPQRTPNMGVSRAWIDSGRCPGDCIHPHALATGGPSMA
jgi:hypothetical protein